MPLGAYQYTADDGITYQIGADSTTTAAGAGDLPAATGSEPVFPAFDAPRKMICKSVDDVSPIIVFVPCDSGNSTFRAGPGGTVFIGTEPYTVLQCVGEIRLVDIT